VLLTMKPGVGDAPAPLASPPAVEVLRHAPELGPGRVNVLEIVAPDPATQDIREAERIVAGGRGLGGPNGFRGVGELAEVLHAAVGASRVAVDSGWIESGRQVGQTGKSVAPKLYVAIGISGASHHLMGMRGSEKIVAINNDPGAPIFSTCHLGAVADWNRLIPLLVRRIREDRGSVKWKR